MAKNLYTTVGQSAADNLRGDTLVYMKTQEVILKTAGEYKRGQLLMLAADGEGTLPTASDETVDCVLLTDIGEVDGSEDVPAAVALTGEFNENVVLWGDIPEANQPAVKKAAAEKQLYIAPMVKAPYIQFGEV